MECSRLFRCCLRIRDRFRDGNWARVLTSDDRIGGWPTRRAYESITHNDGAMHKKAAKRSIPTLVRNPNNHIGSFTDSVNTERMRTFS